MIELTIKNYRCFPDFRPARLEIRPGFSAFVGVNNSGKSSLLRFFYEFRRLFDQLSNIDVVVQSLRGANLAFNPAGIQDNTEIFSNRTDRDLELEFRFKPENEEDRASPGLVVVKIQRPANQFSIRVARSGGALLPTDPNVHREAQTLLVFRPNEPRIDLSSFLLLCESLRRSLYIGPFRNALNIGSNADYFDIQVGQAFVERWRNYKTGASKAANLAAYRISQEIGRIFGIESIEINAAEDNQTLQLFIDGASYRLSELGSGLTQFILVLVNAAIRRPSFILIDEPELNLHPSLQLDFLTTLGSHATEGVFFSTHSYGLARASGDRVYAFSRVRQGESDVRPLESVNRLSEFLGELSFAGYKEMGFEKILLVEGPTEVKTIQQFLRLLRKDHQIVLLPLGGSSLINGNREAELQELKRISNNVFALIDSEKADRNAALDPQREAFVRSCKTANIECHTLARRATENYFSDRAVKAVLGNSYEGLKEFEKLKDKQLPWGKEDNWRIAREMTLDELNGTDLLGFLRSL